MSGRRLRRAAAAVAVVPALGAILGALAALQSDRLPSWSVPALVAAAVLAYELADLARSVPSNALIERPAVSAATTGRVLVVALLATAAATLALLAAAVPARHGLATGLVGIAAAALLFLAVYVFAAPRRPR
jgi:hypothetical protein